MKTQVWHLNRDKAIQLYLDRSSIKFPDDYTLIAYVDGADKDRAFERTNSIDRPWQDNDDVTPATIGPKRSTSVGDVVTLPDGSNWTCEPVGWVAI